MVADLQSDCAIISDMDSYRNRNDFIQRGPLLTVLGSIALPLVLSNFIQNLFDLSSAIWLGQIGVAEFAASNFVWPVTFLFVAVGFGIYVAGAAILARLIGQDEELKANHYASQILILTVLIGLVLAVLGWLFTPLIVDGMRAGSEIRTPSIEFLQTTFLGFPFIAVYFAFQAILNAQGRTREMLTANAISLIFNIVTAPFFIFSTGQSVKIPFVSDHVLMPFGAGLGVTGAALSTVIAKFVLFGIGYFLVLRYSQTIRLQWRVKPDMKALKAILFIAVPAMLGQGGAAFGFIILHAFIEDFGTAVMAAYALVNRVTGLVMQPAMGIGGGLTSIVGQNLGARKPERVTEAFHKANLINLVVSGLGAIAIFIWAEQLILFFLQSGAQDVLHHSMIYIYYILPTIPLMGMFSIFQGLFQGSGFTKYAMYMEIGRLWVIRLPMIVILSRFSNMGSTAIWLAMSMSNLLTIAYGFYLYRRKHWLGEFRPA